MALATGQITIIDYNDALTLTGFIGSNHPKTQMYNPDNGTYTPNWASTNLVLTPSLYKLGTTSDLIASTEVTSVKWYEAGSSSAITSTGSYALSGAKNHVLTIKANLLAGLPGKDWICEVTYRDATTKLDLTHKMSITFSRVVNGGGIADAIAWAPDGNVFKNAEVTSLKAQCDLWRGSIIDNTSVTYQWYQQDPSILTDQGGGIGWKKLTETPTVTTGVTTNILTVFAAAVTSFEVFKCVIKDTDSASNTYNSTFADTLTFIDNSDPIQVSVLSSGGDVFKNGVGQSTLTARLFQAGEEIDVSGTTYTYTWSKYDKNGAVVPSFSKTGKSISVGSSDVDVKGTFEVNIT